MKSHARYATRRSTVVFKTASLIGPYILLNLMPYYFKTNFNIISRPRLRISKLLLYPL